MSEMLTDRYRDRVAGVLSCYDWIAIPGTLPGICYVAQDDELSKRQEDSEFRLPSVY